MLFPNSRTRAAHHGRLEGVADQGERAMNREALVGTPLRRSFRRVTVEGLRANGMTERVAYGNGSSWAP
jgi:hypothetical protein